MHWLKIDVEGLKRSLARLGSRHPQALARRCRVDTAELDTIQPLGVGGAAGQSDYVRVYADGLNRFYATVERAEQLKPAFALPKRLDDVQLSKHSFMCRELCQELQEQQVELAARYESAQLQLEQADVRHQAMLNSLSWRITSPLRKALHLLSFAARKREAAAQPQLSPGLGDGSQKWMPSKKSGTPDAVGDRHAGPQTASRDRGIGRYTLSLVRGSSRLLSTMRSYCSLTPRYARRRCVDC